MLAAPSTATAVGTSAFLPARYVENTSPEPFAFNSSTTPAVVVNSPLMTDFEGTDGCSGFTSGRLGDVVIPATYAFPCWSTATVPHTSGIAEYVSAPPGSNFVRKPREQFSAAGEHDAPY